MTCVPVNDFSVCHCKIVYANENSYSSKELNEIWSVGSFDIKTTIKIMKSLERKQLAARRLDKRKEIELQKDISLSDRSDTEVLKEDEYYPSSTSQPSTSKLSKTSYVGAVLQKLAEACDLSIA